MIDPRELRIGNIIGMNLKKFPYNWFQVMEPAKHAMRVTDKWNYNGDTSYIPRHDYYEADDMEGIPLTTEWLERFGWQYLTGQTSGEMTMDTDCKIDIDWVENRMQIKGHYESGFQYRYLHVTHVHQLQNLYFSLTGKELTLKDKP